VPDFMQDIIEEVSFVARHSEYVDQSSGVSARVSISAYENFLSNIERRAIHNDDSDIYPRMSDLYSIAPSVTGKIELVYEGEQEGALLVTNTLIGKAINNVFLKLFPLPEKGRSRANTEPVQNPYEAVVDYFSTGRKLERSDEMPFEEYKKNLESIAGLKQIVKTFFNTKDERELLLRMEFVLEGLYQNNIIAREEVDSTIRYGDVFSDMRHSRT
jgi:magnesium chelatase subunit I